MQGAFYPQHRRQARFFNGLGGTDNALKRADVALNALFHGVKRLPGAPAIICS